MLFGLVLGDGRFPLQCLHFDAGEVIGTVSAFDSAMVVAGETLVGLIELQRSIKEASISGTMEVAHTFLQTLLTVKTFIVSKCRLVSQADSSCIPT